VFEVYSRAIRARVCTNGTARCLFLSLVLPDALFSLACGERTSSCPFLVMMICDLLFAFKYGCGHKFLFCQKLFFLWKAMGMVGPIPEKMAPILL
jgi:hypothetical protein